ncbi:rab-GTPase-TBC domain-containing protein [Dichotomocladium elegans]|nr:rab-GTPase-TBC domain-containing protein [Dichotomocladium elegans]
MHENFSVHRSFWRREGLRFPGCVKMTRSNTPAADMRYCYPSLVLKQEAVTMVPSLSQSTIDATIHKTSPTAKSNLPTTKLSPSLRQSSTSFAPHKSFNAFLKDTNDEWSDEFGYDGFVDKDKLQQHQQQRQKADQTANLSSQPPEQQIEIKQPNLEKLLQDPTYLVYCTDPQKTKDPFKTKKFRDVLSEPNVDLVALKKISWSGIPKELRPVAWQFLLGYLPCNMARRAETLARKRKEYADSVAISYAKGVAGLDQALWHQIHIDIPRTNPGVPLYQYEATQLCLERILYQWAIRHPASGYVQGINDLVTPIFEVFLSCYIDENPEEYNVSKLDPEVLSVIEADSFWCLSKLLDGIQDNYTFAQPGIQRQVAMLKDLATRIDTPLTSHLHQEGVEFIQFGFRWMNCLLMREMPLRCTVRMWDTYLSEGSSEGFSEFHVYVCAAFLVKWSEQLRSQDFQGIMLFLQQLPTENWQTKDVELLLSEAYMWKTLFHNAPNHLK